MELLTENVSPMLAIIFSIVVIVLSGYTAQKKGMSFTLGLLVGVLFNLIGLLIISFLPDKQSQQSA